VVTGWGKIDGRLVYIYAQDFTVMAVRWAKATD
jgi:acetyl-CoA carboxylase carboxyltransferase component